MRQVTFKVVSWAGHILNLDMLPLLETFMEFFWKNLQCCHHIFLKSLMPSVLLLFVVYLDAKSDK
jgi:hypothetical protein